MRRSSLVLWLAVGGALLLTQALLLILSHRFAYAVPITSQPVVLVTALLVGSGVAYVALLWLVPRVPSNASSIALMIAVGLGMRALAFPSTPILEDDFYRYLWDGAVTSHGHDPYAWAPMELSVAIGSDGGAPLTELAAQSGAVFERINYPWLRSIYPPLAQAAFALAHWLEPWSLGAWRALLLACESMTLLLLLALLRELRASAQWAALYWWNPLAVKELVNSAHMDALLLPFLLAALLLSLRNRRVAAAGCLALATGVKLWPALLLPVVLRPLMNHPLRLLGAISTFSALACLALFSMRSGVSGHGSGLRAYTGEWEMNDALFQGLDWTVGQLIALIDVGPSAGHTISRVLVALTLIGLCLWTVRRESTDAVQECARWLLLVAALFFLSPTQFPWYYMWLLPLIACRPRLSLLALTALLPLYYLRFHFESRGQAQLFDAGVVWIEFLPIWILLAWEWRHPGRLDLGAPREVRA